MEDLLGACPERSRREAESVRRFVGLSLSEALPDETTILNFRHLLERHELGRGLLEEINAHLESQGLRLREATMVDASIIEAPSSAKNRSGERDPEMHQTKKGNQWHFGMKAHILRQAQDGGCGYRDSGQQSYARVRAGQRRLTGESTQECILRGEACRLDRDRVCTGGYYPMDSMVREPCDGIIGDAPAGAIPFHRLFDVVGSLRRRALEGNPGGGDEQRQERCRTGGTVPAEPQRGRH